MMHFTRILVLALATMLVTAHRASSENPRFLHMRRIPVEFIQDGKFNGIGSLEFHLPYSVSQGDNGGKVVYIFFMKAMEQVAPYVHIMQLSTIKMVDKTTVVFSGENDYGFPFSGRIIDYGDTMKQRLSLSIEGRSSLEINDLFSKEGRAFKTKYIPKVDLGMGPYIWTE